MRNKTIYKITITKWSEKNSHHKKGFKKTLLDNNFCSDSKIRTLSMTNRWLFLNLVLTCSDYARDTIELSSNQLRNMLECNRNIDGTLLELQSLQLLTFEKQPLIEGIEGIERNRKEEKRRGERDTENQASENHTSASAELSTRVSKAGSRGVHDELNLSADMERLFKNVTFALQSTWIKAYPNPQWVCHEALKADIWINANPKKAPKDFGRFFSNWLSKSFEDQRKGIASNKKTYHQQNADATAALRKKYEQELENEQNQN